MSRVDYAEQRVVLDAPVVPFDDDGARRLGAAYWRELARFSRGTIRARAAEDGAMTLVLLGGIPLLRFASAEISTSREAVECRYPILGGLLARKAAGSLVLAQRRRGDVELSLTVRGFQARLTTDGRLGRVRRRVFRLLQLPLHEVVSRHFLATARRGEL